MYVAMDARAKPYGKGLGASAMNIGIQSAGLATSALALIPAAGPFAPFAAIGVGLFSLFSNAFRGCGEKCIIATKVVNQAEPYLQKNVEAYMAGGHTRSEQQTALKIFDAVWADVQQGCSNPQLGDAGVRCVTDRQAGACKWKTDGKGGPAGSGDVCWNWFIGYRDPIANDPNVVPDPSDSSVPRSSASVSGGAPLSGGFNFSDWLLPGALVLGGLAFIAGSRS